MVVSVLTDLLYDPFPHLHIYVGYITVYVFGRLLV
jgi:hypothetical protein